MSNSQHQLVGYDRDTERPRYAIDIPPAKLDVVRQLVRFEKDDPEGYDSYEVDYAIARDLAAIANGERPPRDLDYFLESFEKVAS
jgi:hypothetical protein